MFIALNLNILKTKCYGVSDQNCVTSVWSQRRRTKQEQEQGQKQEQEQEQKQEQEQA
jgi:hypothetical protein